MLCSHWLSYPIDFERKQDFAFFLPISLYANFRYMPAYLSSFFSLPVKRQSGVRLSHEEVINQLDNETVSYEIGFGISNAFTDTFRVSIKVETALYENAVAWLKDLVYGSEFDKER